jgi:hypothetical protein
MSKVTITIEMQNSAFDDDQNLELSDILFKLHKYVRRHGVPETSLKDSNGNTVGKLEVKP